ncbi:stage III sporulation protein AE [Heyndrickxia coagulans]|uniref:Stage III sporulation protein AE n=1 Tax=Heyndrickxia coagulans DSM 1 = ATCC 7050 TaxID=1121088 RepID=A0A8B4BV98_HEYCO|nr:stage III sporulation protein AE [Heyndrickxia coagulans]AJH77706.1 stage III sporulation protein AE [Heyndrickxia coagulans DSM 1 = ATCC 7050]MCR2846652.1 stage III sporulation protein AE [Heyndrickxia coagulans]MDR4224358.1 stage III sporulation protein AE [Heyndrickxia coagulans DSM 1 = ATCC 7050]MED4494687.1 stage III sporulation protein AE [Heyndrickxia coagulans]MED4535452.1 stage III sporulation protein AE [Heyndrickxia coagulans]
MGHKKICIALFILFAFCFFAQSASAASENTDKQENISEKMVDEQLNQLDLSELKNYWDDIVSKYGGYLPESQKGSLMDFMKGEKHFSLQAWLKGLLSYIFQELLINAKLLGSLIILTILSILLENLHHSFQQGTISKIAYAVVFMVLVIIALNSFHVALQYALEAIRTMKGFILALMPLLLAVLSTSGGAGSAAFFHPAIIFLSSTSGMLVEIIVLPLLLLSTLLGVVSTLSEQHKATQLAGLLRNIGIGILGAFMAVFLGALSVQGTATAVMDGLAVRTAKFVTGNFVPVVGRMLTDAADTVISASVLLKNTLGIAGVAIVLLIAAFPAIKIFSMSFMFKLASALLQPLGGGPVISCLDIISKNMLYVFAALAIVTIMFFLSITIIVTAGNLTMMMR